MGQDIEESWDDPSLKEFDDMQKYAFVTQRAIDNDQVGFLYRERSEIKIDSGWRIMFGDEDDDYLDNPDNVVVQDLSKVVEWKPELKDLLSARFNAEFEWNSETKQYEELQ